MNKQTKKEIEEITEEMYSINRAISIDKIAMNKPFTETEINQINKYIGEWIKRLREIIEQ